MPPRQRVDFDELADAVGLLCAVRHLVVTHRTVAASCTLYRLGELFLPQGITYRAMN